MRIRLHHDIDDLASDLAGIPGRLATEAPRLVNRTATEGNKLAQEFARRGAGPHGKAYYKRLTAEMTGRLSAEYGPEGIPKTEFVGVGFRHGRNMDLLRSADLIGPKFANDAGDMLEGLFR